MSAAVARNRRRRLALVAFVAGAFVLDRYVLQVSPGLRPLSRHGIEGFLRYAVGDYTGAAAAYREHLRETFATAGLPIDDEEIALLQGDVEHARTLATRAVEQDPRATRSLLTLAEVALDQERIEDALHWTERALAVAPADIDTLVMAAVAEARAGDGGTAIRTM